MKAVLYYFTLVVMGIAGAVILVSGLAGVLVSKALGG